MNVQIRRGVFETNSSSTHTLAIVKDSNVTTYPTTFVIPTHGEFGWGRDCYTDAESKAAYLFQAILAYPNVKCFYDKNAGKYITTDKISIDDEIARCKGMINTLLETLKSHGIDASFDDEFEIVKKHYTFGERDDYYMGITFKNLKDPYDTGYVDHGSEAYDFVDAVMNDPEALMRFLFDPNSYITTGNDNDDNEAESPNDLPADIFYKGN